jgi:hypothetical protein
MRRKTCGRSMQYRVVYTCQPLPEGEPEPDVARLVLVGSDTKDEAEVMDLLAASSENGRALHTR